MSEVERVRAAIDKLEALKTIAPDGLHVEDGPDYATVESLAGRPVALTMQPDLIVTLHGTLDAQIAILQEALRQASDPRFMFPFTGYDRAAIALADAILGDAS